MELCTGVLSWWKSHWADLKSAGLFLGISFWTPLKPQHSNPNPNPNPLAKQLWSIVCLLLPHVSSSLTDSLPSLNLLCHLKTDARFMQDGRKAAWSIPYVSVAFFPSLKHNFIAYHSSKVSWRPYCIFEIHQLWQSGLSWVYSNPFVQLYMGVYSSISLMSSSLLLQQCPACLVRVTWIVFVMGGRWPYSWCLVV